MKTKIYQLKYTTEQEALQDLMDKGVIQKKLTYNENNELELRKTPFTEITEAVVYDIKVPDQKATYDEQGEVLTEATFKQGYHVDIMVYEPIDFGTNETKPNSPSHQFA